jgi:ribosome recycling factor
MIDQLLAKGRKKMEDTLQVFKQDLATISTGRANPSLLDAVKVEVYGSFLPLNQLANVSASEATSLTVQVWDKSNVKAVEKAIINANLGFNPLVDGANLRIAVPKLSEERRKELVKLAKKYAEDKKIAIRNIRRDVLDELKKHEKELGKDQGHGFNDLAQKLTDEFIKKIDETLLIKEKDLMKI